MCIFMHEYYIVIIQTLIKRNNMIKRNNIRFMIKYQCNKCDSFKFKTVKDGKFCDQELAEIALYFKSIQDNNPCTLCKYEIVDIIKHDSKRLVIKIYMY